MTLLVFLLILSFLVVIHEAGHYLAAKVFGIGVYEFGMGYPPRAFRMFRKWGTDFTMNWLPFGGFVRLAGEEREVESSLGEKIEGVIHRDQMFYNKPVWQRVIVIVAGAAVNFVFGIVAFAMLFSILGIPETKPMESGVAITQVAEGSPAAEVGLQVDDVVRSMVVDGQEVAILGGDSFIETIGSARGKEIVLQLERGEEELSQVVRVRTEAETPENEGSLGVGITDQLVEYVQYPWWQMPFRGAYHGTRMAIDFGWMIVTTLGQMLGDLVTRGIIPRDIAGPVGIVYAADKQNILADGLVGILNFAAILSINLAIVNVLPIPALDGGRVVFLLLEKLLGKRFKAEYEQWANAVGFTLLIGLIVLISIRDVGVIVKDFRAGS